MKSLCPFSDADITNWVSSARSRVILIAPGISDVVAQELVTAWRRLGPSRVQVTLDADAEVCRLGYGTLEALEMVRKAATDIGTMVTHQAGLRIGVLICDERMVIFSPVPLLVEAGKRDPGHPNAVVVSQSIEAVEAELGLGLNGVRDRKIGLDAVTPETMGKLQQELHEAPPARFDLARRMRVFNMHYQFVELEMTGCSLSRRKVPLPPHLMGLSKNKHVRERVTAQFALLTGDALRVPMDGQEMSESRLMDLRKAIEREFLIRLAGYGSVIRKQNKARFLERVEELQKSIKVFHDGAAAEIARQLAASEKALFEAFRDLVRASPPEEYVKYLGPNPRPEQVDAMLQEDLRKALGEPEDVLRSMGLRVIIKDLAYESLSDGKFIEAAQRAGLDVSNLHVEGEATEAR